MATLIAKKRDPIKGFGTLGRRKLDLFANYYRVETPTTGYMYHYDVDMVFEKRVPAAGDTKAEAGAKKKGIAGRDAKAVPRVLKQRIMSLFLSAAGTRDFLNGTKPAYDGEKNLYSVKELKVAFEDTFSVIVTVPKDEEGGERVVKVSIQPCKPLAIAWAELYDCMAGRWDRVPKSNLRTYDTVAGVYATVFGNGSIK